MIFFPIQVKINLLGEFTMCDHLALFILVARANRVSLIYLTFFLTIVLLKHAWMFRWKMLPFRALMQPHTCTEFLDLLQITILMVLLVFGPGHTMSSHPCIFCNWCCQFRVVGEASLKPVAIFSAAGYILDRLPVHHRAKAETNERNYHACSFSLLKSVLDNHLAEHSCFWKLGYLERTYACTRNMHVSHWEAKFFYKGKSLLINP